MNMLLPLLFCLFYLLKKNVCDRCAFSEAENYLLVPPFSENILSYPCMIDILLYMCAQVHIAQSFGEWSREIFCKAPVSIFFFVF